MWNADELYVRELAKQVKELSEKPEKRDIIRRYTDINSLIQQRPPVLVVLLPSATRALFDPDQTETSDPFLQRLERDFKIRLQRDEKVGDDFPVTDIVHTGFRMSVTNWMNGYKHVILGEKNESSFFEPCISSEADFGRLQMPELLYDADATEANFNRTHELFGDVLTVVKGQPYSSVCGWGDSMFDQLVEMRGLTQIYYDMVDRPEVIHTAMKFMTQGHLALLNRFRELNLLVLNNGENHIGSSSLGFTTELPGPEFNPDHIVEKNLWGFAHAQELSEVSPDMLEEFVLPYQAKILNRAV